MELPLFVPTNRGKKKSTAHLEIHEVQLHLCDMAFKLQMTHSICGEALAIKKGLFYCVIVYQLNSRKNQT